MPLPPGATDCDTAPTGWHVPVLPSGATMPASEPDTWHRFKALYGPYPWRAATKEEIAEAKESDQFIHDLSKE